MMRARFLRLARTSACFAGYRANQAYLAAVAVLPTSRLDPAANVAQIIAKLHPIWLNSPPSSVK